MAVLISPSAGLTSIHVNEGELQQRVRSGASGSEDSGTPQKGPGSRFIPRTGTRKIEYFRTSLLFSVFFFPLKLLNRPSFFPLRFSQQLPNPLRPLPAQ